MQGFESDDSSSGAFSPGSISDDGEDGEMTAAHGEEGDGASTDSPVGGASYGAQAYMDPAPALASAPAPASPPAMAPAPAADPTLAEDPMLAADPMHVAAPATQSWTCSFCTLVNTNMMFLQCEVCGNKRADDSASAAPDAPPAAPAGPPASAADSESDEEEGAPRAQPAHGLVFHHVKGQSGIKRKPAAAGIAGAPPAVRLRASTGNESAAGKRIQVVVLETNSEEEEESGGGGGGAGSSSGAGSSCSGGASGSGSGGVSGGAGRRGGAGSSGAGSSGGASGSGSGGAGPSSDLAPIELRRLEAIEENRRYQLELFGPDPLGLRQKRTRGAPRGAGSSSRAPSRASPQGTRSSVQAALAAVQEEPSQLKFALLSARGLYQELSGALLGDESSGGLRAALACEAQGERLRSLLSEPGKGGEYMVVALFLDMTPLGCAVFRDERGQGEGARCVGVALLAVDGALEEASAAKVGAALLGYVAMVAARRHIPKICLRDDAAPAALSEEIGASESPWIAFTEDGDGSSLSVYQELGSGRVATAVTQHTSFLQKLVARAQNAIREEGGASSGGSDGGSGAGGGGGARSARGGGRSPAPGLPQLGELIAVWEDQDTVQSVNCSQHFLARVVDHQTSLDTRSRTQKEYASQAPRGGGEAERVDVELHWVGGTDDGKPMTHKASTLEQITPRAAADKEMSLLCGYAFDTHGSMICGDVHTWCRYAVAVGGAGWEEQLEEENLCILEPPELLSGWELVAVNKLHATPELLMRRALKAPDQRAYQPSAAGGGGGSDSEPDAARLDAIVDASEREAAVAAADMADAAAALAGAAPTTNCRRGNGKGKAAAAAATTGAGGGEELLFFEAFCGESPMASILRDENKDFKVKGLDNDRKKAWPHWDAKEGGQKRQRAGKPVGSDDGGQFGCNGERRESGIRFQCGCNKLHEDELIELDFHKLPLDHTKLDQLLGSRRVVWAHFGIECDTFSTLSKSKHQRLASNFFMGTSQEACEANRNVHHMLAICYFLRRRYPHILITIENPWADLVSHPLMLSIAQLPVTLGGLGLVCMPMTFCLYNDFAPHKLSALWGNSHELYLDMWDPFKKKWRKRCSQDGCHCADLKKHMQVRNGIRGNSSVRNTDRYPDGFCRAVHMPMKTDIQRGLKIDDRCDCCPVPYFANADGHYAHCCATLKPGREPSESDAWDGRRRCPLGPDGKPRTGDLIMCDGCPRAFHRECEPPRSRWSDEGFLCDLCAPVGFQALYPKSSARGSEIVCRECSD